MSPSRGLNSSVLRILRLSKVKLNSNQSRTISIFTEIPKANTQIYVSRSHSPYLNLSIEHHLLTKSPAESTILFLYTNKPSIIIGRNQNPWVECNHAAIRSSPLQPLLVRRRSGGGTVWHDEGNVNYSVICPTEKFDRNKHAEMVVRALHSLDVQGAKVNERHDIVMNTPESTVPFKISGSAYKLTRLRSLHHGTCLLSSPNLKDIGKYLGSPAKKFIKARGVDSVRSKITNVHVGNEDFENAVVEKFRDMYGNVETTFVGEEEGTVPAIEKGVEELSSPDWIYRQTPQFHFSYPSAPASEELEPVQTRSWNIAFIARNGVITKSIEHNISSAPGDSNSSSVENSIIGTNVYEVTDWAHILPVHEQQEIPVAKAMNDMLLVGVTPAQGI
ncbi:Class II aaRS and biotin synthetase [Glarea lozoyensis ATCC 20868]|uniref:Putative lipoate-protein ligase A n=1 Tax=Glarea lozoyensis (strain ATCC 20868 / MF5171) TaxID=1116229 RepID=S3DSA1_GLAL2|nr:Class II aaRS and biotin synthetase [Glarea lozoyensis ATCC 20868]EPE34826.1 Class II aaRS and biotin synthetase [Glarea lozoyensis ATCC 20868]